MKKFSFIFLGIILFYLQVMICLNNFKTLTVDDEHSIIDIKNPSVITKLSKSTFKALLINNSDSTIYVDNVEIIVKDNSNNVICTFKIKLEQDLDIDKPIKIQKEVNYDLSDAYSFDFVIN